MPTVPSTPSMIQRDQSAPSVQPSMTNLMLATAMMHQEGKLVSSQYEPPDPMTPDEEKLLQQEDKDSTNDQEDDNGDDE